MSESWIKIADHGIRGVRRAGAGDRAQWTNPNYLVEHTPPALLFARLEDLANRYLWGEDMVTKNMAQEETNDAS